jgi:hypothetical protein
MVFLLIIFGIVVSIMGGTGEKTVTGQPSVLNIDVLREPERTNTDEPRRLVVSISNSDSTDVVYADTLPQDDAFLRLTEERFEQEPACRLIRDRLAFYARTLIQIDKLKRANHIQVNVCTDAKFRIISFILKECAQYRNDVPWVRLASK